MYDVKQLEFPLFIKFAINFPCLLVLVLIVVGVVLQHYKRYLTSLFHTNCINLAQLL